MKRMSGDIAAFSTSRKEKRGVCWKRPIENAIAAWFDKMGIPYESILPVELEGERGVIEELTLEAAVARVG